MGRLDGRTAIVTGASSWIGQATAHRLLAEGVANLVLTDLPGTSIEGSDYPFRERPGVHVIPANVNEPSDLNNVRTVASELGTPPSILVNVAGAWQIIDFTDSDPEQWMSMIQANFLTALSSCHAFLPIMLEQGLGSIVNFASTAGEYGSIRPSAAYAGAKGGVIAFTKSLAREVSPRGIRVNAISPGPIDTPALKAATPEQREQAAARTLLGRIGTPDDIAAGVAYLASDDASFVTGTVLQVNGGSLL